MENKTSTSYATKFSTSQLNVNLNNSHQLIPREQTFVLDRKLITIHSEDRDTRQWPNPNTFEVQLPTTYTSVSTIQLVECNITTTTFTFSREYQNTKFSFKVFPNVVTNPSEIETLAYYYMNNGDPPSTGRGNTYYGEISEGFYRPEQLVNELEFQMNRAVANYLIARDEYVDPNDTSPPAPLSSIFRTVPKDQIYSYFKVKYDSVTQQIWFANTHDRFELRFSEKQDYVDNTPIDGSVRNTRCDQPLVWNYGMNWGLPFYLGFSKDNYHSTQVDENEIHFGTMRPTLWITAATAKGGKLHYVKSPNILDIYGNTAIYMELEKMNTCDEISPYRTGTNRLINDYNGTVNSYFAKIPLTLNAEGTGFSASNSYMYLYNIAQFNPVIDKLRRLKITMRYHDGRLVDFKDTNFNFTISLGQIHDEIARNYVLRIPPKF
jgi:hypothetical protein